MPKPVQVKAKTLRQGPYAGLASAEDLPPEDISALEKEGFRVATPKEISALKQKGEIVGNFEHDPGIADHKLILNPDGKVLYSDVDIHGVYDLNGKDAWGPLTKMRWNNKLLEDLLQHYPHDRWTFRNDPSVAGKNYGPQPDVTVYLPDGTKQWLRTIAEMRDFYRANNIPWDNIYPQFNGAPLQK